MGKKLGGNFTENYKLELYYQYIRKEVRENVKITKGITLSKKYFKYNGDKKGQGINQMQQLKKQPMCIQDVILVMRQTRKKY